MQVYTGLYQVDCRLRSAWEVVVWELRVLDFKGAWARHDGKRVAFGLATGLCQRFPDLEFSPSLALGPKGADFALLHS